MSIPEIINALPGDGWVIERLNENGSKTVLPLAGWAVMSDGEVSRLPFSLGKEWITRPIIDSDGPLIRKSGFRMSQQPKVSSFGDVWSR